MKFKIMNDKNLLKFKKVDLEEELFKFDFFNINCNENLENIKKMLRYNFKEDKNFIDLKNYWSV